MKQWSLNARSERQLDHSPSYFEKGRKRFIAWQSIYFIAAQGKHLVAGFRVVSLGC